MKFIAQLLVPLSFFTSVWAASLVDSLNGVLPAACSTICSPWTTKVGTCVTGLASKLSFSMDPVSGAVQFDGDKIGIYFCVCNEEAKALSASCLACLSQKYCYTDALTTDTYAQVCSGQIDILTTLQAKRATATC